MDSKTLYVCKYCGKQMLEVDNNDILKLVVSLMFSGYLEDSTKGVFILQGTCRECASNQQLIFCSAMVNSG